MIFTAGLPRFVIITSSFSAKSTYLLTLAFKSDKATCISSNLQWIFRCKPIISNNTFIYKYNIIISTHICQTLECKILQPSHACFYNLQFTIYNLQFTTCNLQLAIYNFTISQFTISQFHNFSVFQFFNFILLIYMVAAHVRRCQICQADGAEQRHRRVGGRPARRARHQDENRERAEEVAGEA